MVGAQGADSAYVHWFVQEVRRWYPFFPAALKPASWVIVVVWIVLGLALRLMSLRSRCE